MKNKKIVYIIILIVILLTIDQLTKIFAIGKNFNIITNNIKIEYQENIQGSFGVGQTGTFTFIVTNAIVIGILVKFMKSQSEQIDKKTNLALIMVISGALGNLIDRVIRGHVVKFFKIATLPTFNFADFLVILGYVLLAIFFALYAYNVKKQNKKEGNNIGNIYNKSANNSK